jgi:hypothetical protein
LKLAFSLVLAMALLTGTAHADLAWRWSCKGPGFEASGMLTTKDAPNADGFYEIVGIEGEAGGVSIIGLQPAGTSIPLNAGYPVDNLVREAVPQLTIHGFAFVLANSRYANPFYGSHFSPPAFYAFISDPSAGRTSEPKVEFSASLVGRAK